MRNNSERANALRAHREPVGRLLFLNLFFCLLKNLFLVVVVRATQDNAGGADGEERAILDDPPLTVAQYLVVHECARVAGAVAQHIFDASLLVAADIDDTMVVVDAGVVGLYRSVDSASLMVASYHVVTHLQGDDLLVVEHVLNDDDGAISFLVGQFVGILLLLRGP